MGDWHSFLQFASAWIVLPLLLILAVQILSPEDALFRGDELLVDLAAFLAVIAMGTLLIIFLIYSYASSPRLHPEEASSSLEGVLCCMIEMRQEQDQRIARAPRPTNWIMWQLWQTPEAEIVDVVDGLIWQRMGARFHRGGPAEPLDDDPSEDELISAVQEHLRVRDPEFLDLGFDLVRKSVTLASAWVCHDIKEVFERPYPPPGWWQEGVSVAEAERDDLRIDMKLSRAPALLTGVRSDIEWRRLKGRMVQGDELRKFSSPSSD